MDQRSWDSNREIDINARSFKDNDKNVRTFHQMPTFWQFYHLKYPPAKVIPVTNNKWMLILNRRNERNVWIVSSVLQINEHQLVWDSLLKRRVKKRESKVNSVHSNRIHRNNGGDEAFYMHFIEYETFCLISIGENNKKN